MALDAALLGLIGKSLNETAIGSRVEKITMPYKDCICLSLNKPNFKKTLLISSNPNSARIHFSSEKFENPPVPPMLCMLLRKKLGGGRLKSVRQYGIDRVLLLDFDCKNELGDDVIITIVVEMLGRLSNIIFIENGKIIESVRRVDPEEGKRFILPGATYEFPQSTGRLNLFETDATLVAKEIASHTELLSSNAFSTVIDGLSPIIYRELSFLSFGNIDLPISEIDKNRFDSMVACLDKFKQDYKSNVKPVILRDETGKIKEFTFIPITQYGDSYNLEYYDDVHSLLENYFSKKDNAERIKQLSLSVTKTVNNLISRTKRKIAAREKELLATEKKETYRIYGELIKANLHLIKSGSSSAKVMNYYDPECEMIEIPLDSSLSPVKNSHRYFNLYRKLSTASGMLLDLIALAEQDLIYFESVLQSIKMAKTPSDLSLIKEELIDGGYIRTVKSKRVRKTSKPTLDKYVSSDGFEILVGKNNLQNDYLTTKVADKYDIWFHTKNIPGSHVVVLSDGREVPDKTLEEAAIIAATNSKASASRQVAVDYTPVKFVKKPAGAKPGMVIYKTNKTAFVDPDEELVERLKSK